MAHGYQATAGEAKPCRRRCCCLLLRPSLPCCGAATAPPSASSAVASCCASSLQARSQSLRAWTIVSRQHVRHKNVCASKPGGSRFRIRQGSIRRRNLLPDIYPDAIAVVIRVVKVPPPLRGKVVDSLLEYLPPPVYNVTYKLDLNILRIKEELKVVKAGKL
ncbi:hypothetical protein BJ170DRAFT_598247 [Xylariales sp. AK1849]|nr:hypothetical protein BJ170DRAFT_598247 [Xylariales sp. AK1849]